MSTKSSLRRVKPHSSLRAWRAAVGFSQRQAAAYLGVSQSYFSKLERREQQPRPKKLKALSEKTGVPLDELMGIAS